MLKTIRGRLFIPILSVVLAAGICMGYASYKAASDTLQATTRYDAVRSAHALTEVIELVLDTARMDISGIAADQSLHQLLLGLGDTKNTQAMIHYRMKDLVSRQPLYNSMIALNRTISLKTT